MRYRRGLFVVDPAEGDEGRRVSRRSAATVVGILGPVDDPQVAAVRSRARASGSEVVPLDLAAFPDRLGLRLAGGVPSVPGVDLRAVTNWYVRSIPLPVPARAGAGGCAAERERRSFVAAFVAALRNQGAVLVNPPETAIRHFRRPEQLGMLRDAGVPVPATLVTDDPDAVRAFADRTGHVVYKPVAGGGGGRRLRPDDLTPSRLDRLSRAAVLFQEEVPGRNIRVYLVGGRVVASYEITSGAGTAVRPVALRPEEVEVCRTAARACGMVFSGIDLRRPDDRASVLLECNPSPVFAGIEHRTGVRPVTDALVRLLRGELSPGGGPGTSPATACP